MINWLKEAIHLTEPKLISPLLDGFVMGNAMSEHNGISCHPAMKEGSDDKYIVKIISLPASQVQLDALLLTGAYKDTADALDYFTAEAESIVRETEILDKLSRLDGFLAYEATQIVPKDAGLGNHVYLLGSYKRSLERHIHRSRMTHLEAVNLGLDLCQALAICRRSGYMYVNLKPANIFISKNREYRIGDIGFVSLDSLKYTSLPGKYFSAYSAPESKNPLNSLNTTHDTYSAGMVLYQVFNDGVLPAISEDPAKPILPPVNADYEIAAIIMKAIAPDPANRWNDPIEMGQALVAYMQRNTVNNTPLAPKTELVTDPEAPMLVKEAATQTKILPNIRDIAAAAPIQEAPTEQMETSVLPAIPEEPVAEKPAAKEPVAVQTVPASEPEPPVTREEEIAQEISSLFTSDEAPEFPGEPISIPADLPPVIVSAVEEDDGFDLNGMMDEEVTEELYFSDEDSMIEDVPGMDEDIRPKRSVFKKIFAAIAVLIVLGLFAVAGLWYYQSIFVQSVHDIELVSTVDEITVRLNTTAEDRLLSVICSDTYGNSMTQTPQYGEVHFTGLLPNSQYKINVEINGFHKLVGKTSDVFNTAAQSNIVTFSAIAGPEDGSVLLNIVVDGAEPESWTVNYSAEGEEEKTATFSGHSVTIKELVVGKEYTFTLADPEDSILTGTYSVTFTSTKLIMADNLQIISCSDGNLKVKWNNPEGAQIDSWTVRCYNDADYEQVLEDVTATEATFTGIDTTRAYTVEVTAAGMTQPIRTSITTNPITVTSFSVSEEKAGELNIVWEHQGKAPVGGWLLMYRMDNGEKPTIAKCDEGKITIKPAVPKATYHFEIQAADSTSIFSNQHSYTVKDATAFDYDDVTSDKVSIGLLKTPEDENWLYESIDTKNIQDTFAAGEPISIGLYSSVKFWLNDLDIHAMFVIRDQDGNVRSDLITEEDLSWQDLWYDGNTRYGELDLPVVPAEAGKYTLEIYFNHCYLTSTTFTIQ